jgi:hypothetical protein
MLCVTYAIYEGYVSGELKIKTVVWCHIKQEAGADPLS